MKQYKKYTYQIDLLFEQGDFPEDDFFADGIFAGRKIIVYGGGEGFHWIQEILIRFYDYKPSLVLDRRFQKGDVFEGIPACSPDDFLPTDDDTQNSVVIVAVGKKEYHNEIVTCLKRMGFQNIIFLMGIYEIHNPFKLPVALHNKGFEYFLEQKDRINDALKLLADDESCEIYTKYLQTHMTRKPVPLPARPREEQYFPKDIELRKGYTRFVNCGAYDGDTVRLLESVHGRVEDLACFETEPHLYGRLVDYIWANKDMIAEHNIIAVPCAVYDREALMQFKSGGGLGSRVTEDGDVMIQTVTLDHAIPGFNPTFICMDIEGAELEALKGAEGLIRENQPDLGVCVYHSVNHLWDIPLYLHGLGLGYRFYLRNYTTFTSETVLYATV